MFQFLERILEQLCQLALYRNKNRHEFYKTFFPVTDELVQYFGMVVVQESISALSNIFRLG